MDFSRESEYSVEEMEKLVSEAVTEKEIADVFAYIWNVAFDIGGDVDEYDIGTPEYEKAKTISDAWFALMTAEEQKIMDILASEGCEAPKTGKIYVTAIFMERNGYECCSGWWFPTEECDSEEME